MFGENCWRRRDEGWVERYGDGAAEGDDPEGGEAAKGQSQATTASDVAVSGSTWAAELKGLSEFLANDFKTFRADVDYEILNGFKLRYGGDYKEYGFSSWEQRLYSRNLSSTGTTFTAEAGFALPAGVCVGLAAQL